MKITSLLAGLCLSVMILSGCGGGDAASSTASPIVGHWQIDGFDITAAFNSDGRVKMNMPDGSACVGSYSLDGDRLRIDYDESQPNCTSMGASYSFESDDVLTIGMGTTYTRIDREDDLSI